MDDINGMMKYRRHSKRKSATKPLDNVIIDDGVNQQDGKQNSAHALVNVKQPSPMEMSNGSSKPIWSGIFKINSKACLEVDAHLSSKACKQGLRWMHTCSRSLQPVLEVVKLPRFQVWPKGWESSGPVDKCIGLYFFPSNSRSNEVLDELVNEVIKTDSALKVTAATADLLIFPSVQLPEQNQLYQGKHYLWGLFRRRKDISDEVFLGGEQKGSACVVPVYGGQQAQHVLADEAQQLASSEQITLAMNHSHGENPPLVESTCKVQIDEAMDLEGGEQNSSACAMLVEGGQQAHLLNQVDEAQTASSEQIICAMNYSHGENPQLVEGTYKAQIDESMDLEGGEQNSSACAMLVDEGGQQAQHLLNQVDEAQTTSSEEIICAMNYNHVENPPLVECTCEAQTDEAMDLEGGEQDSSVCAMLVDEGGQQAQHLLNQEDEAQTASSEQIICAMNASHVENQPLVECTCEAQIDEAIARQQFVCQSVTKQPNFSEHHPEEVSQPGDTFTFSSTKPNVSSVAAQLAKKTVHGQSCSGSEPVTTKMFGVDIARKPQAQELIEDVATEGVSVPMTEMPFFAETPTEMVTTDSVSGNSPRVSPGWTAVGAGMNPGTNHQQHYEGEPSQPDVEPSQACLELFPVRVEQMGLAAPGTGTSNIVEVDLELSLGMPLVLHL